MTWNGFEIGRLLGQGRFSDVRELVAPGMPGLTTLAVKVYRERLDMATAEFDALSRLDHPGIVRAFHVGDADGERRLVLERAEDTLRGEIDDAHAMRPSDRAEWARGRILEILDALSYAHSKGVVHRDLKPENVLVIKGKAKLADFNQADDAAADRVALSGDGPAIGSRGYRAPEGAVDARSDVFSAGAVLYEMLTGSMAFVVHASAETGAPAWTDAVVARALHSDPKKRFRSAKDMTDAVRARAIPPPAVPLARRAARAWLGGVAWIFLWPLRLIHGTSIDDAFGVFLNVVYFIVLCLLGLLVADSCADARLAARLRSDPPRGRVIWWSPRDGSVSWVEAEDLGNRPSPRSLALHGCRAAVASTGGRRLYAVGDNIWSLNLEDGSITPLLRSDRAKYVGWLTIARDGDRETLYCRKDRLSGDWYILSGGDLAPAQADPRVGESWNDRAPDGAYKVVVTQGVGTVQIETDDGWLDSLDLGSIGSASGTAGRCWWTHVDEVQLSR